MCDVHNNLKLIENINHSNDQFGFYIILFRSCSFSSILSFCFQYKCSRKAAGSSPVNQCFVFAFLFLSINVLPVLESLVAALFCIWYLFLSLPLSFLFFFFLSSVVVAPFLSIETCFNKHSFTDILSTNSSRLILVFVPIFILTHFLHFPRFLSLFVLHTAALLLSVRRVLLDLFIYLSFLPLLLLLLLSSLSVFRWPLF